MTVAPHFLDNFELFELVDHVLITCCRHYVPITQQLGCQACAPWVKRTTAETVTLLTRIRVDRLIVLLPVMPLDRGPKTVQRKVKKQKKSMLDAARDASEVAMDVSTILQCSWEECEYQSDQVRPCKGMCGREVCLFIIKLGVSMICCSCKFLQASRVRAYWSRHLRYTRRLQYVFIWDRMPTKRCSRDHLRRVRIHSQNFKKQALRQHPTNHIEDLHIADPVALLIRVGGIAQLTH